MMLAALMIALVLGLLLLAVVSGGARTKKAHARPHGPKPRFSTKTVLNRWSVIKELPSQGGNGLRQAILEADKLLDYVLQGQGYRGDTMAERMRSANARFSRRNGVWAAHKLRNAVAHEINFDLVPSQVKSALNDYERAIKDLGGGL